MIFHLRLCVQTIVLGICTIHRYLAIFLSAGTLQHLRYPTVSVPGARSDRGTVTKSLLEAQDRRPKEDLDIGIFG